MITVVKNADFSANGLGKIVAVTDETLAIIAALGKTTTNTQKVALQVFLNDIEDIKSKMDFIFIPALASTIDKARINVLSLYENILSTGSAGYASEMILSDDGIRRTYPLASGTDWSMDLRADSRASVATNTNAHIFLYAKDKGYGVGSQGFGNNLLANAANELVFGGVEAFITDVNTDVVGVGFNYVSFSTTSGTATVVARLNNGTRVTKTVSAVAGGAGSRQYCDTFGKMKNPVSIMTYGSYLNASEITVLENATTKLITSLGI